MTRILLWSTLVTALATIVCKRSDAATASLSLPQGHVREGDDFAMLICRINDPPDEYETVFIREINTGSMDIIFIHGRVSSNMRNKYSVSQRGEHSFALTLRNISRADAGNYGCRIAVPTGTTSTSFVASGTAALDVVYLPDIRVSPHCSMYDSNSRAVDSYEELRPGDTVRFQCLSQAGNPIVDMKWIQNGKKEDIPNSRVSKPASHVGVVVSELDVTLLPEHFTLVYSCVITSSGYPSFSRKCTLGPFVSVSPSATLPPFLTHSRIDHHPLATTKTINVEESIGPSNEGIMSTLGLPILAGVPAAILFLVLIIVVIVVIRRQRRQHQSNLKHRESQAHLITINVNEHKAENGNLKRESIPVQHVVSPNGGQLYAVIQKTKPEDKEPNGRCSKETPNIPKTVPTVSVISTQNTKFYPPPPAYPTQRQQAELNRIIDNNDNDTLSCGTRALFETSSSRQDGKTLRADPSTHEYATLNEVAPSPGENSPTAPHPQRTNPTGLYNTVKLY